MSLIPEKVINFRSYVGTASLLVSAATDVELPKFESIAETIMGAGIAGEYQSPTPGHLKAMSLKLKFRTATPQVLQLAVGETQLFDVRGAIQVQESASGALVTQALRIECRGPLLSFSPGKVEPGKPMDAEAEQSIAFVRISVDGAEVVMFDALNYIYKVGGVDRLAATRAAMGG